MKHQSVCETRPLHANPTYTVFTGPMYASKTSKLLMELERYKFQHKKVALFKPSVDDRYSKSEIVTHTGWKCPAHMVTSSKDVLEYILDSKDSISVVAVDEAFMIKGIADVLEFLYKMGYNIVVSTLDIAANGKPFDEVASMMVWATKIEKCSAVCTVCGKDAYYTHKKLVDNEVDNSLIAVGGVELYEPRCWNCHLHISHK